MYAIIETGGKQYRVQEGDVITVEKLNAAVGETVCFDHVLVLGEGEGIQVGTPYVGTAVEGKVVEEGKGKKVIIFKYKAKKDYRKKQGHRQPYTMVEITGLGVDSKAPKAEEVKAEEAKEIKVSASMKKDELIAVAKANNIEVDEKATKAVIIETIEAALK
ncbi:MAG: 50S ribosomal protein L21 [Firmicutes bacterium]|nr:50S ribosomal protein L21 [Clostridiales bacterium]MBQ5954683.1 50S ribosomal protein L21 [Bacillota bacterium]MBQ6089529.1 50S ribosomal protein L21 [Bacillota bacterium]MBQ6607573.1 50S ribosomal protein L21 [Bacillota bacterium]MBR2512352.1 50S ribosomal protein L21 [Bacillota bacterium]